MLLPHRRSGSQRPYKEWMVKTWAQGLFSRPLWTLCHSLSCTSISVRKSYDRQEGGKKKKIILLRAVEQQIGVSQKVLSNSSLKVPKTGHKTQCSWILYGNSRWCTSVDFWLPLSLLCSWWINTLGSSYHNLYFVGSYLMLNFTEQQREAGWSGG